MSDNIERLLAYVNETYPQFKQGISESITKSPERFEYIAELYLSWIIIARGNRAIEKSVDAFVQFTTEVNLSQAKYEFTGHYENQSFAEVYESHYSQKSQMDGYLWGVYLTNFLWAHHLEISLFFESRFLSQLPSNASIIEIAPGHGGWGAWALHQMPEATLRGYDISPSSIQIATSVARAAGVQNRTAYYESDALDLENQKAESCDAVICSFLIEHLEEPDRLFAIINKLLRPGCTAFVTGALTAAQIDHIYEFNHESEMLAMAESHGLRVLETLSTNPQRLLKRARFIPRSMAILLQKPLTVSS
ncbi:MAG: class I SAM-dependent methyltransferase [Gammaproteobacteria bacterium]|nr:class I SAM-dependent methyltransferase [Gammaproteobacteria bacterium]